jgi:hypothetical protein
MIIEILSEKQRPCHYGRASALLESFSSFTSSILQKPGLCQKAPQADRFLPGKLAFKEAGDLKKKLAYLWISTAGDRG